jgi:hypothetical protein
VNDALYGALILVAYPAAWLWVFWLLFVLVMGFYRAWLDKRLAGVPLCLAAPILVAGYVIDLVSNWTLAVAWFQETPRRPFELVTDRLTRYLRIPEPTQPWDIRRQRHAQIICRTLLDPFDPNPRGHCSTQGINLAAFEKDMTP